MSGIPVQLSLKSQLQGLKAYTATEDVEKEKNQEVNQHISSEKDLEQELLSMVNNNEEQVRRVSQQVLSDQDLEQELLSMVKNKGPKEANENTKTELMSLINDTKELLHKQQLLLQTVSRQVPTEIHDQMLDIHNSTKKIQKKIQKSIFENQAKRVSSEAETGKEIFHDAKLCLCDKKFKNLNRPECKAGNIYDLLKNGSKVPFTTKELLSLWPKASNVKHKKMRKQILRAYNRSTAVKKAINEMQLPKSTGISPRKQMRKQDGANIPVEELRENIVLDEEVPIKNVSSPKGTAFTSKRKSPETKRLLPVLKSMKLGEESANEKIALKNLIVKDRSSTEHQFDFTHKYKDKVTSSYYLSLARDDWKMIWDEKSKNFYNVPYLSDLLQVALDKDGKGHHPGVHFARDRAPHILKNQNFIMVRSYCSFESTTERCPTQFKIYIAFPEKSKDQVEMQIIEIGNRNHVVGEKDDYVSRPCRGYSRVKVGEELQDVKAVGFEINRLKKLDSSVYHQQRIRPFGRGVLRKIKSENRLKKRVFKNDYQELLRLQQGDPDSIRYISPIGKPFAFTITSTEMLKAAAAISAQDCGLKVHLDSTGSMVDTGQVHNAEETHGEAYVYNLVISKPPDFEPTKTSHILPMYTVVNTRHDTDEITDRLLSFKKDLITAAQSLDPKVLDKILTLMVKESVSDGSLALIKACIRAFNDAKTLQDDSVLSTNRHADKLTLVDYNIDFCKIINGVAPRDTRIKCVHTMCKNHIISAFAKLIYRNGSTKEQRIFALNGMSRLQDAESYEMFVDIYSKMVLVLDSRCPSSEIKQIRKEICGRAEYKQQTSIDDIIEMNKIGDIDQNLMQEINDLKLIESNSVAQSLLGRREDMRTAMPENVCSVSNCTGCSKCRNVMYNPKIMDDFDKYYGVLIPLWANFAVKCYDKAMEVGNSGVVERSFATLKENKHVSRFKPPELYLYIKRFQKVHLDRYLSNRYHKTREYHRKRISEKRIKILTKRVAKRHTDYETWRQAKSKNSKKRHGLPYKIEPKKKKDDSRPTTPWTQFGQQAEAVPVKDRRLPKRIPSPIRKNIPTFSFAKIDLSPDVQDLQPGNTKYDNLNLETLQEMLKKNTKERTVEQPQCNVGNKIITLTNLHTLLPNIWLEDDVISGCLGLLHKDFCTEERKNTVQIAPTDLVIFGGQGVGEKWHVNRQLETNDLTSEAKTILFPLYLQNHWILVVADVEKETMTFYDSIKVNYEHLYKRARELLTKEIFPIFKIATWQEEKANIPQQTNTNDCGLFPIIIGEKIIKQQPISFSLADIKSYRDETIRYLLPKMGEKAKEIYEETEDNTLQLHRNIKRHYDNYMQLRNERHQSYRVKDDEIRAAILRKQAQEVISPVDDQGHLQEELQINRNGDPKLENCTHSCEPSSPPLNDEDEAIAYVNTIEEELYNSSVKLTQEDMRTTIKESFDTDIILDDTNLRHTTYEDYDVETLNQLQPIIPPLPEQISCKAGEEMLTFSAIATLAPNRWLDTNAIDSCLQLMYNDFCKNKNAIQIAPHLMCRRVNEKWVANANMALRLSDNAAKVIIPLLVDRHFILVVADVQKRQMTFYDSLLKGKYSKHYDTAEALLANILHLKYRIPKWKRNAPKSFLQQTNCNDCGCFLLAAAEKVIREQPVKLTKNAMEQFRGTTMRFLLRKCGRDASQYYDTESDAIMFQKVSQEDTRLQVLTNKHLDAIKLHTSIDNVIKRKQGKDPNVIEL